MKASEFLSKQQRGPNYTYLVQDVQRIEAEHQIMEEINGEPIPTGRFADSIMDALYVRLRSYMTDTEFVTQQEREMLAELMATVKYTK